MYKNIKLKYVVYIINKQCVGGLDIKNVVIYLLIILSDRFSKIN